MNAFSPRNILAAAWLLGGALWAQTAQAGCYCQQGHLHGNQCIAPVGPNNSMVPIALAVCTSGAASKPEARPPSAEEMRRLNEQVAAIKRDNPRGCNPPQDGLRFCWTHWSPEASGETRFYYVMQDSVTTTHGMQYLYDNRSGRLLEIQIYDRGIIPKGENGYAFNPDGSVTVVEYARNDSSDIKRHYRSPPGKP